MEMHTSPDRVIYPCILYVGCVLNAELCGHAFNDTEAHNSELKCSHFQHRLSCIH